jgi:hypothetical protein
MVNPSAVRRALVAATTTRPRSQQQALDPLAEEEAFDQSTYPGGDVDSEAEDGEDSEAENAALDRMIHAEDTIAVAEDDEFIESSPASSPFVLTGCPPGWKPPTAPADWEAPAHREEWGEPAFADVDNPGDWRSFTFRPRFKKGKKKEDGMVYSYHAMPAGATPVPINPETGCRTIGDWSFFYKGWERDFDSENNKHHLLHGIPVFRSGADRSDMFPDCRKGSLSGPKLKQLGMTAERMKDSEGFPDALFFHQLLLPMCDPSLNDTEDFKDPRKPFYLDVSRFSNGYATTELGLGSGLGHSFQTVRVQELVKWDGTVVQDGVRGGSNGAIFRRFAKSKYNTAYDPLICKAMTKTRWLEIKRVYKLCNNLTAPKKGAPGYDPAYKYKMIWDVLIHNTNAITGHGGLDLCGDETSWPHQGFAEAGSGIIQSLVGKPVSKGGQTVIVSDVDRIRPRAAVQRHKKHDFPWPQKGPSEVRMIYEKLELLMPLPEPTTDESSTDEDAPSPPAIYAPHRGILRKQPHMTWDNYFSGEQIFEYAAEKGFGLTMTCRRDRLPGKGVIDNKYWHKEKTDHGPRAKAARYEQPVFAIKRVGNSLIQHTSFQSTSSCNITSVNALNGLGHYVTAKERGRGATKRRWGIEMNESRELYLKTYGVIDTIDHYIQNCCMSYR